MDSFSPSPDRSPVAAPPSINRACQACNSTKVKCVSGLNNDSYLDAPCARCFRLKKECIRLPPKTRKRRSPSNATRTTKLEEKLEALVSLLVEKQPPSSLRPSPTNLAIGATPESHSGRASSFHSSLGSSSFEATELLAIYKARLAPNFPFVVIPEDMSAQELQLHSPYLYDSILMVATYHDPIRQASMAKEVLENLTASIVLRAEARLDLLQGLLVYNAWFHYHSSVQRLTSVFHMAIGLVYDLNLKSAQPKEKLNVIGYAMNPTTSMKPNGEVHTPDEMRAYLGCMMLASAASVCMKGADPFRYSPYVDQCCDLLSSRAVYHSDRLLAISVRLQSIIDRIQETLSAEFATSRDSRLPTGLLVDFFRGELESFKSSLPLDIQQGIHFILHYHSAEIHLHESAIHNSDNTHNSSYGSYSLQQLNMLQECLVACQQFFNVFFTLPTENFTTLSIIDFGRVSYAMAILFRLSLLDLPGWDLRHVRQTADISVILGRLIHQFERTLNPTASLEEISISQSAFTKGSRRLRGIKEWLDLNFPAAGPVLENQSEGMIPAGSDLEMFEMCDPFRLFDEIPWQDIEGGGIVA